MTRQTFIASRQAQGITLIEILVSLVILSLGLLGVAALQGRGLQASYDAYLYSQASSLAYEMAERIRANEGTAYNLAMTGTAPTGTACNTATSLCTATEMASYDLASWINRLNQLPSGQGQVTKAGAAPSTYTIIVRWKGFSTSNCAADGTTASALGFTCFTLTVQTQT